MEIFDQKLIHKLVDLEFATVATATLLLLLFCQLYIYLSILLLN